MLHQDRFKKHVLNQIYQKYKTLNPGDEIIKDLPVNYRPPSNAGIAIPTSAHVYNADPSKPM